MVHAPVAMMKAAYTQNVNWGRARVGFRCAWLHGCQTVKPKAWELKVLYSQNVASDSEDQQPTAKCLRPEAP